MRGDIHTLYCYLVHLVSFELQLLVPVQVINHVLLPCRVFSATLVITVILSILVVEHNKKI